MSFKTFAIICATALALPVWAAEAPKESLASLIQHGNRKAALEQIRAGADVNEAQPDGTRPIHWAVYKVDHELLDALIAKKAKVEVANQFGSTPLAEAAKLADATMVKALLAAGARPDTPESGRRDRVDAGDQDRGVVRRRNAGEGRRECQRAGNISQSNRADVGRRRAEKWQ